MDRHANDNANDNDADTTGGWIIVRSEFQFRRGQKTKPASKTSASLGQKLKSLSIPEPFWDILRSTNHLLQTPSLPPLRRVGSSLLDGILGNWFHPWESGNPDGINRNKYRGGTSDATFSSALIYHYYHHNCCCYCWSFEVFPTSKTSIFVVRK